MLINLCEKEVMGGRSGPVGRTVRKYNSFLSREVSTLFGLEGRTVDSPPLGCGQSAGVLKKSSRQVVSLAWAERLDCGRSGPEARTVRRSLNKLTRDVLGLWWDLRVKGGRSVHGVRTVRRSFEKMTRDVFASGGLHEVKGGRSVQGVRTVRPSNFQFVQRRCLSECSECLNGFVLLLIRIM